MIRKMQLLLSRKIFPALRTFVYNHGMRPKHGSLLYSPTLNLIHLALDVKKKLKRK
jgi:hypothetical protein